MNASEALLKVESLTVAYPAGEGWLHALQEVSFEIGAGEIVGFLGSNGAGKTPTLTESSKINVRSGR